MVIVRRVAGETPGHVRRGRGRVRGGNLHGLTVRERDRRAAVRPAAEAPQGDPGRQEARARLRGPGRDAVPGRPLPRHASLVAGRQRARECVSGRPVLAAGPGSRRSGVRAGHRRWLAAWSMHQAKAHLLDHRYAIDPSGMYHDWAIGDPLSCSWLGQRLVPRAMRPDGWAI